MEKKKRKNPADYSGGMWRDLRLERYSGSTRNGMVFNSFFRSFTTILGRDG
ncbi:MAG: hypothetical protein ABR875_02615 [Minisyncoccia bacterium]